MTFNAFPQRRNKSARKPSQQIKINGRLVNPAELKANRKRMDAYIQRVLAGEIEPRYLPAGRPDNFPVEDVKRYP